jgi:hypothetical protein
MRPIDVWHCVARHLLAVLKTIVPITAIAVSATGRCRSAVVRKCRSLRPRSRRGHHGLRPITTRERGLNVLRGVTVRFGTTSQNIPGDGASNVCSSTFCNSSSFTLECDFSFGISQAKAQEGLP